MGSRPGGSGAASFPPFHGARTACPADRVVSLSTLPYPHGLALGGSVARGPAPAPGGVVRARDRLSDRPAQSSAVGILGARKWLVPPGAKSLSTRRPGQEGPMNTGSRRLLARRGRSRTHTGGEPKRGGVSGFSIFSSRTSQVLHPATDNPLGSRRRMRAPQDRCQAVRRTRPKTKVSDGGPGEGSRCGSPWPGGGPGREARSCRGDGTCWISRTT
jgi:hypothetical protein